MWNMKGWTGRGLPKKRWIDCVELDVGNEMTTIEENRREEMLHWPEIKRDKKHWTYSNLKMNIIYTTT
jgi:hypothetical protein